MKKKNSGKAIMLMAAVTMMLSACGNAGNSNSISEQSTALKESEQSTASEEKGSISFPLKEKSELSFITSAEPGTIQNPNDRIIFQRLENETNVHINWTCFPTDQFGDKKNLALANTKKLPDGLFNADMSDYDLLRYAKQGVIIPVEDLIDKYMPNLKKVLEENPEYKAMITAPDGHIYAFPWIEQLGSGKEAIQTIGGMPFINKKWLDKLGLSVPKTTDELKEVLESFKKNDMAGDGKTIPMSFIMNGGNEDMGFILGAFGEGYGDVPDHIAVSNEKKVIYTATQDGYKQGLIWMHELAKDGLIDPEAYTHNWSTYVAKGKAGRYGLCFTWDCANVVDNMKDYVPLPALTGPDGQKNAPRASRSDTSGLQRGRCVLTSACKDTALAAAWLDLMYDPLQSIQNNWGTYDEEGQINVFEKTEDGMLKHRDLTGESKSPWEIRIAQMVGGPLAILNSYYGKYVTCPYDAQYRLDWIKDVYVADMKEEYVYPNILMSQEDLDSINQYATNLNSYVNRMKSDFVMNGNVEEKWDEYLKTLEKYGLSKYMEIMQKNLDNYYAKLGK
jgi:putative aldouronate transport system substrate-binding protein